MKSDFKKVFSTNAAIMLLIDAATGTIADANQSACKFYGYPHEVICTLNISDINILPPQIVLEQVAAINKKKISHAFYQHRISDGTIKDVQVFASPIVLDGCDLNFAIVQDVTAQKITEAETKRFKGIADNAIPFIGIANMNREVFYFNQSMRNAFAVPENADLSKYHVFDFYTAKGKGIIQNVFSEIQENGYWKGENEMQSLDGRIYQVLQSIVLIRDEEGNPQFTSSTAIDITSQKQAEREMAALAYRYQTLLHTAIDGIHVIDKKLELVEANEAFCKMLGYTKDEVLQLNVSDWDVQWSKEKLFEKLKGLISESAIFETRHRRKDGTLIDVEINAVGVTIQGEDYLYASARDITDRKLSEKKMQLSESKFRAVLDNSFDAIGVHVNGIWEMCNPATLKLFGYSNSEELIGKPIVNVIAIKERQKIKDYVCRRMEGKNAPDAYLTLGLKKDGSEFDMEVSLSNFMQDNQLYVMVILRDITERQNADTLLKASLSGFEKIASRVPGVVYQYRLRTDGTACFPFASNAISEIYRVTPDEVREDASIVTTRIHPDDIDNVAASIQQSAKTLKPWQHEYRVKFENGTIRSLYGNAIPEKEDDGAILWHGFITDITERKLVENKNKELLDRLQHIAARIPGVVYQFRLRPDGTFCFPFASKSVYEIYRVTAEEVREDAASLFARIHPDDLDRVTASILQSARDLTAWQEEYRVKYDDGTVRTLLGNSMPQLEEDHSVLWSGYVTDITERRIEEDKIALNETRLKLATNAGKIGVWDWDIPNNILSWDDSMYQLYGLKKDDFNGAYEAWIATLYKDDRAFVEEEIQAAIRGEKEYAPEFRIALFNGTVRMIKADSQTIFDEKGIAVRMIGTNIDITERRQIEDKLRISESNLKQAELIGGFGYWKLDLKTQLFEFSKGAAEIYGVDEKYVTRDEVIKLRLPEYNLMMDEALRGLIEENKPYDVEYKIKRKKDAAIIDIHIISTYDNQAQIVFGSVQNITDRKNAEAALTQSEEKFRHLVAEMNIGVVLHGPKTEILLNNQRALELLGLSEEQLLGKTSFDPAWNVIHEDGLPFPAETHPVSVAISSKELVKDILMGVYHPVKKERVWLQVTALPELDEEGRVRQVIVTFTDITENRKKQEALHISEINLKNAQHIGHIGNWTWDIKNNKLIWSDEIFNIYRIGKESYSGKFDDFITGLIHPEDRGMVKQYAKSVIEKGIVRPFEHRIILSDGSIRYLAIEHGELKKDSAGKSETLTGTTQDITEKKNRELDIERLNSELKELAKYLQVVRAAERNKLAIEVHDKLGQRLVALRYDVDWLKSHLKAETGEIMMKIDSLSTAVIDMIQDFKKLYYDVNPTLMEHFGLYDSIEFLIISFKKKSGINIIFTSNMEDQQVSKTIKLALYKASEACLDNILLHAKATHASLMLFKDAHSLSLEIEDDGCGFDLSAVDAARQHGILEIRERVDSIGGKLNIDSVIDRGTIVKILLSI